MPERASRLEVTILTVGLVAAVVSGIVAYRLGGPYGERFGTPRLRRVYDQQTGELKILNYDTDGDGEVDDRVVFFEDPSP